MEAYEQLLGHATAREADLDLNFVGMEAHDLSDLEIIFTEEEVWNTIKELPPDRPWGRMDLWPHSTRGRGRSSKMGGVLGNLTKHISCSSRRSRMLRWWEIFDL